jgi:hypothetical protein
MRSLVEWIVALALFAGAMWVGLPWVRELAPLPTGMVTLVESELPALPGGVPYDAESVPFLMLESGVEIRVGLPERELKSRAMKHRTAGPPTLEPGVIDDRIQDGRSRFWVVLDKTGPRRDREVTAIYVR